MRQECKDRGEWLSLQSSYIGASRAAAACGIGDYGTPLSIYMGLCGLMPHKEPSPEMEWGNRHEPTIAQAYMDRTGRELISNGLTIWRHERFSWHACTPDFLVSDDPRRGIQIKTARSERAKNKETGKYEVCWGPEGSDSIPVDYIVQCQQEMACCAWDTVDVPVLIGGSDFRIYTVERNDELIERIIQLEGELWNRFLMRHPPDADWRHPLTSELIQILRRPDRRLMVSLDSVAQLLAGQHQILAREIREKTKEKDLIQGQLVEIMGEASQGILPNGGLIRRWATPIPEGIRKASERTYFKISKPTEGTVDNGDDEE